MKPAGPHRRALILGAGALVCAGALASPAAAVVSDGRVEHVLSSWYRLLLELIRGTATYSPPVAARAFAYLGVTVFETVAQHDPALHSLAGQVNGLTAPPAPPVGGLDAAAVLHGALAHAMAAHFGNTGPTGQRAMDAMAARLEASATAGLPADLARRSLDHGQALSRHILDWSATDGGAVIENLGFPDEAAAPAGPADWVPTSTIGLQQRPLLPGWGSVRPMALPPGDLCDLPPPTPYSEDPGSAFHAEAMEVYTVSKSLTEEQKIIARFWSDDPMLSPTPPGHWVSIAMQIFARDGMPLAAQAETLALLGIAISDAFVACWRAKYQYNLLRPVTYIRRVIDPAWEPLLITPPFPEYPSGHSSQSGAAAGVMAALFGADFAFDDATHQDDGLAPRHFANFDEAAREAALSRFYGGIHFMPANRLGLEQGACVATHVLRIKTRV